MFLRKFFGITSLFLLGTMACTSHSEPLKELEGDGTELTGDNISPVNPNVNPQIPNIPNIPSTTSNEYSQKSVESGLNRTLEFTANGVSSVTVTYKIDSTGVTKTDEAMTQDGTTFRSTSIALNQGGDNLTYTFKYTKSGGTIVTTKQYTDTYYPNYSRANNGFTDDFDGTKLSSSWKAETVNPVPNELQTNNESNVSIQNQKLVIQALDSPKYTSGRISSKDSYSFQYGRIDVNAKLPLIPGVSPGILLVPKDESKWPTLGMISVMNLGTGTSYQVGGVNTLYGVLQVPESDNTTAKYFAFPNSISPAVDSNFHTYSVIWKNNNIQWQVDGGKKTEGGVTTYGNSYATKTSSTIEGRRWPFDDSNNSFYITLYLAVGGEWTKKTDNTIPTTFNAFPSTAESSQMVVDYVHVYR